MKKATILILFILALVINLPVNVEALSADKKANSFVQLLVDSNKKTTTNNNTTTNKNTNNKNTNNKKTNKNTNSSSSDIDMSKYNQPQNCNTLLGNPSDSNSVAWLINKILTYATIGGIVLVVVLSSVDFTKVIVKSDDDEMSKAIRKLGMRLILAALLFFIPTLTNVMLGIFGLTSDSTCGIQQG